MCATRLELNIDKLLNSYRLWRMPVPRVFVGRIRFRYIARVGRIKVLRVGSEAKTEDHAGGKRH